MKYYIRIIAALIAMLLLLAACQTASPSESSSPGSPGTSSSPSSSGTSSSPSSSGTSSAPSSSGTSSAPGEQGTGAATEQKGVQFPLEEKFTFTIGFRGNVDYEEQLKNNTLYPLLLELTNVEFEWVHLGDDPIATLNALIAAGNEPDVIYGSVLNDSQLCDLAYGGFLMPIEDYITDRDLMPNYNTRGLDKMPQALGAMTMPDGHIYSVSRFDFNVASYLESPLMINKNWLDQLNMDIPKTIDEFEAMLIAFRDNDMNGNGNPNDEIPLLIGDGVANPYAHLQALLGFWGIATKNSALDSYTTVKNSVVSFAPMTQAYRDAIRTISRWYQEGLIWSEMFTANTETFNARRGNDVPLWGAMPSMQMNSYTTTWEDQIIIIPYPDVPGYDKVAYFNPGYYGYKNTFILTRNAKNPEIIMAWLDMFYSREMSIYARTGLPDDEDTVGAPNRYDIIDGEYVFYTLSAEDSANLVANFPTWTQVFGSITYLNSFDDYEDGVVRLVPVQQMLLKAYNDIYKDFINKEIWPRPYYTAEDNNRANILRTDIFSIVSQYEARWVTGLSDIDADWDNYIRQLNSAGVQELVEILQNAYDIYLDAIARLS